MRGRTVRILGGGTLLLALLSGCQPEQNAPQLPPVTEAPSGVDGSYRKYAPVTGQLRLALEDAFPGIGWQVLDPMSMNEQNDGECTLFLPTMRSDGNLVSSSDDFKKVMAAVNPILNANGFSTVSALDDGADGYWSISSGNAQGATVSIGGRTWVVLQLDVPVQSASCSTTELAGLEP